MRLAIVNVTAGGLSGGYRKYLRTLIPLLIRDRRISQLDHYLPTSMADQFVGLGESRVIGFAPREVIWGFPRLRSRLRQSGIDAVFIPTARWLDCGIAPTIAMVRNMEPLVHPLEGNAPIDAAKNLVRARLARHACDRATRVIAVSEFVSDWLVSRWRVPAAKLGVVYHGVDEPIVEAASRPASLAHLELPFVFTAGSIRPARGLVDVLTAMADERAQRHPHALVIAGGTDAGSNAHYRALSDLARRLGIARRVCWAGQLTPAEMAWCYRNADVFAMTSRVEACPNIALEAMSHGCLCVSTNCAPMPEVFGEAAMYYPAGNGAKLAEAISAMLTSDDKRRTRMKQLAVDTARRFSWSATARRTIDEIEIARAGGR